MVAKIAALIVPSSRVDELQGLGDRVAGSLALYFRHRVEIGRYVGQRTACVLLHITPDPLNPNTQPVIFSGSACVACGYYWPSSPFGEGDSATRIAAELADAEGMAKLALGDGVYAFARWDAEREQLCAGVDKLGMRPLFWTALPCGGYAVASELKVLVPLRDAPEPNWSAWEEFLAFGNVFGSHTLFTGIERLGPAEVITFRGDGHASRVVEHFLENIRVHDRPIGDFVEEQSAVFRSAIKRLSSLSRNPASTILTLSGGHDSRRILAELTHSGVRPTVYTVPEVLTDGSEYESGIVRDLCRFTHLTGYTVYPRSSADRMSVRWLRDLAIDFESAGHNYSAVLAFALDQPDAVNYDGLAGDIALSGLFMAPEYFQPGGKERFIATWPSAQRGWIQLPASSDAPLNERLRAELERWRGHPNQFGYFYLMGRTRRMVSLAPLLLQANVFESLCPYLDREVMRSAFSFPPSRLVGGHMQPRLIQALDSGLGYLPSANALNSHSHKVNGIEQRRERQALIHQAGHTPIVSRAYSTSTRQRWRFQWISAISPLFSERQSRWEFEKATALLQLAHFESVSRDSIDYHNASMDLRRANGRHPDWCRPMQSEDGAQTPTQ